MGVSSVHIISDGSCGPQMVDVFTAKLEALGAVKAGSFSVECDTYYSNPTIVTSPQRVLNLIISSEYPASAFSLIEGGQMIIADSSFEQILANLANFYTPKKLARTEVRGTKWTLNDFVVKLGSCVMSTNFKAVVAEIEYGPCSVPSKCWESMKELAQTFVGPTIENPHQHLLTRMNELYSPVDTIYQYNDIFNQIKKQTAQVVANRV